MKDSGYVLRDIDTNEYYCGMVKWSFQLKKANIYPSFSFAEKMSIDEERRAVVISTIELKSAEDAKIKAERKKFLKSFLRMKLFE